MKINRVKAKQVNIIENMNNSTISQQNSSKPPKKQQPQPNQGLIWTIITIPMIVAIVISTCVMMVKVFDIGAVYLVPILLFTVVLIGVISFFALRSAENISEETMLKGLPLFLNKLGLWQRNRKKDDKKDEE